MIKKKKHRFRKQRIKLRKGLTRKQAALAALKKATRDYRGMKYNPTTGECILT